VGAARPAPAPPAGSCASCRFLFLVTSPQVHHGDEVAYHEGYARALQDLSRLLHSWASSGEQDLQLVEREIRRRIEEALDRGRCSLAAAASGDAGY